MAANRKLLAVAVACSAAVIGLAGCGSDEEKDPFEGMSADKIADKAADASKDAGSFKVSGEGKQDGKPLKVDFAIAKSGECKGKADGGAQGGTAEFLVTGDTQYMKGDEAFWKDAMGGAQGSRLKDKWVKTPNEKKGFCNADDMFKSSELKGLKREKDAEVDGEKAAVLTKNKSGKKSTFYVATEGKPYFLKVVTSGKEDPGTMYFSDYGKPVVVKAPPANEVMDLKELMAS
ncbi:MULTISPECIES: hypothetical protein [Streptomyces]|uniref:hypothetical protein n=1 Tax=Streptomyces TaxID=1883 RepID=UPI001E3D145F|nr:MULTISPECIES: hypothetical protein [Streptomyces]UFQ17912.1 hypothetical protein J2N69_24555 [Streptomyces huasconensis]WCL87520.1 hypothetical protein PPN52_24555 [Streptomyces sp. JCM 35825]